jgi:beta-xylosidase
MTTPEDNAPPRPEPELPSYLLEDDAEPLEAQRTVELGDLLLCATGEAEELRFFFAKPGQSWQHVGGVFDLAKISDDYGSVLYFTGGTVGLCVQDLDGTGTAADFEFFNLQRPASAGLWHRA